MGSPFSNDPPPQGSGAASPPAENRPAAAPEGTTQPASPAQQKFVSCRWRKAADNGIPDHCGHRDVLPMAGATGFQPDAWCPDCEYFKQKRTPRKREEIDRDRDRDWRW